jgi:hypothetical protein
VSLRFLGEASLCRWVWCSVLLASKITTVPFSKRTFYKKWNSNISTVPCSKRRSTRSEIRISAPFPVVTRHFYKKWLSKISKAPCSRRTFYKKWHSNISKVPCSRRAFYKKWHSNISTVPCSKMTLYKKWHSKISTVPCSARTHCSRSVQILRVVGFMSGIPFIWTAKFINDKNGEV